MSLSDCEQCWETPCICGHDYKRMSTEYVTKLRDVLNRELERRGPVVDDPPLGSFVVPDRDALAALAALAALLPGRTIESVQGEGGHVEIGLSDGMRVRIEVEVVGSALARPGELTYAITPPSWLAHIPVKLDFSNPPLASETATGLTSLLAFSMARDNGGFIRRPHWQDWLHYEKPGPSGSWPSGWRWNRVNIEDGAGFDPADILATDWEWTAIDRMNAKGPSPK